MRARDAHGTAAGEGSPTTPTSTDWVSRELSRTSDPIQLSAKRCPSGVSVNEGAGAVNELNETPSFSREHGAPASFRGTFGWVSEK
jgi:hypothetical protein